MQPNGTSQSLIRNLADQNIKTGDWDWGDPDLVINSTAVYMKELSKQPDIPNRYREDMETMADVLLTYISEKEDNGSKHGEAKGTNKTV